MSTRMKVAWRRTKATLVVLLAAGFLYLIGFESTMMLLQALFALLVPIVLILSLVLPLGFTLLFVLYQLLLGAARALSGLDWHIRYRPYYQLLKGGLHKYSYPHTPERREGETVQDYEARKLEFQTDCEAKARECEAKMRKVEQKSDSSLLNAKLIPGLELIGMKTSKWYNSFRVWVGRRLASRA